jgi:Ser/Thr protein kinase RdoA (MazF antagonist)
MEELLTTVKKEYGLSLNYVEKVTKGVLSENYILNDDTTKFFFKKYRYDDEERIREIHAAKKYFADNSIPVILPIETISGNTYFALDNFYYVLFPFVEGR